MMMATNLDDSSTKTSSIASPKDVNKSAIAYQESHDIPSPREPQIFTQIPTLSLTSSLQPATRPAFLTSLRHALLHTGFLYLTDLSTFIPPRLTTSIIHYTRAFFETLPTSTKLAIEMKNAPSFLGYSRLDNEMTAGSPDHREQLDLATPHAYPIWGTDESKEAPPWHNLWGPNQWPDEDTIPDMIGFKACMEAYMSRLTSLSTFFMTLIAEALGMTPDAFDDFFDANQAHKMKLVKYPEVSPTASEKEKQGVGPHKDSMLCSFLLQASRQRGLQAQNSRGQWIDCEPVDGTLVVALGQGLEAITDGVCASTTHRVLSPTQGQGPRYSVPFFQGVSFDAQFESMDVPAEVREVKRRAVEQSVSRKDDVEFTFVKGRWKSLGEATLMNRVKSHQDVSERWYPNLLAKVRKQQVRGADEQKSQKSTSATGDSPHIHTLIEKTTQHHHAVQAH